MNEAYVEGFVRQCEARGVDPEAFVKRAFDPVLGSAAWGGLAGLTGGAAVGALTSKRKKVRNAILAALAGGVGGAALGAGLGATVDAVSRSRRRPESEDSLLGNTGELLGRGLDAALNSRVGKALSNVDLSNHDTSFGGAVKRQRKLFNDILGTDKGE